MKPTQTFFVCALCALLCIVAADLSFSIKNSNVPNLEYEVDAIECVRESYILFPDNIGNQRSDAISELFEDKHTEKNGWNIAEGCMSSYTPNSTIFIEVLVRDLTASTQTVVKIYN